VDGPRVATIPSQGIFAVLAEEYLGKCQLGIQAKCENSIQMDLREIDCEGAGVNDTLSA
jgi:hypothetical protein